VGRTSTDTYIANTRLFDGNRMRSRMGVLIEGEALTWLGPHVRAPVTARKAGRQIDGSSGTVTPGLIDCHVHLCFDGGADFLAEAKESEPLAALKCVRNGRRHLAAGVTSVRDLGGLGAVVCEVGRAVEAGIVEGPTIVASGQALTISGGHGWNSFARQADGAEGFRLAVREQIRSGARSIKVISTGGVLTPGVPVDFRALTQNELAAAVDEAHAWGYPIGAHAIGRAGIANCVSCGVDSIEHGFQIDRKIAQEMKKNGVFLVPTISAIESILDHVDEVPSYVAEKARQVADDARESFQTAVRTGVPIACGTDAGTLHNPHGSGPLELVRMVRLGLSPIRALQAATSRAADLLRLPGAGILAEGSRADVVLWNGDPSEDIASVMEPRMILLGGRPPALARQAGQAPRQHPPQG
jgi:imidazolonepropionase-like amidohydrolase